MKKRLNMCVVLAVLLGLLAPALRAEDNMGDETQKPLSEKEQKALYDSAMALYGQKQYAEAAQALRDLAEKSADYRHFYMIGEIEYAAGRNDLSIEAFEAFLEEGGDQIDAADREYAEKAIEDVESSVGFLTVLASSPVEVWVDDEHRGDTPLQKPIVLMAGAHALVLRENGEVVYEKDIAVTTQETVEVPFPEPKLSEPQPAKSAAPQVDAESPEAQEETPIEIETAPSRRRSPLKPVGIVTAGIGGALVVAGIVTGRLAVSKSDELATECPQKEQCDERFKDLKTDADRLEKVNKAFFVTGAVLTITGIILAVAGHKRSKSNETITATPVVGTHLMGVMLEGRF